MLVSTLFNYVCHAYFSVTECMLWLFKCHWMYVMIIQVSLNVHWMYVMIIQMSLNVCHDYLSITECMSWLFKCHWMYVMIFQMSLNVCHASKLNEPYFKRKQMF